MPNHDRFECQTVIDLDAILQLELVLDIYPSLSLILRYIYCLVFQGASSITAEEHIDCPSIILPSTSKLLVGLDLFNCVNRASQRKALMHHLTLKVTTSKMTFKVS